MGLEIDIKSIVLNYLIEKQMISSNDLVINEFTYGNFSRRVDLAFIKNNEIYGIEIKSEFDTLNRLDGQVKEYLKVFDKVIVAVATKHLEHALKLLPESVALWEFNGERLKVVRRGRKVKIRDKSTFIDVMRVADLIKVSNGFGLSYETKNRHELSKIVSNLPVTKLREAAFKALFSRYSDGVRLFFSNVKHRRVENGDLTTLSLNRKEPTSRDLSDILEDLNKNLFELSLS
ncbi:sce7726 family protein [Moritella sp.]|uniref:sce7726 family protein n=1 Tax=Moritella sp. TaxID=78556 RepID=UPI001D31B86C|nr:sce7726 family protein [Moritella sp.]MCJ8350751.1 sce7726 family protein [Moritella sp.]NQZ42015.1 sce7726 family protein [Moritella sp.]